MFLCCHFSVEHVLVPVHRGFVLVKCGGPFLCIIRGSLGFITKGAFLISCSRFFFVSLCFLLSLGLHIIFWLLFPLSLYSHIAFPLSLSSHTFFYARCIARVEESTWTERDRGGDWGEDKDGDNKREDGMKGNQKNPKVSFRGKIKSYLYCYTRMPYLFSCSISLSASLCTCLPLCRCKALHARYVSVYSNLSLAMPFSFILCIFLYVSLFVSLYAPLSVSINLPERATFSVSPQGMWCSTPCWCRWG